MLSKGGSGQTSQALHIEVIVARIDLQFRRQDEGRLVVSDFQLHGVPEGKVAVSGVTDSMVNVWQERFKTSCSTIPVNG